MQLKDKRPRSEPSLDAIATLWLELRAAADAGDREAAEFVWHCFGPWAREELRARAS